MDVKESLEQMIREADRAGANKLLDEWVSKNGHEHVLQKILEPVLQSIGSAGEGWRDYTIAHGYTAAKITEDVLGKVAERLEATASNPVTKGPVVIGNIEDDYHALGRKMVTTFLRAYGWEVCDLGNDVSATEFVDTAVAVGAKVVGASAMMHSTAKNIVHLREEIDRRALTGQIQLAVGGAIFVLRPELVEEFGGDGTARNALDVPTAIEELWQRAEDYEKRASQQ